MNTNTVNNSKRRPGRIYFVAEKDTLELVDYYPTLNQAVAAIAKIEANEKSVGIYEPGIYIIIEYRGARSFNNEGKIKE